MTAEVSGLPARVFYAAASQSADKPAPRITLLLVDVSGSMNTVIPGGQTRFQAARSALTEFLANFQDGVDQVAIVPFGSHNVAATIRSATFATTRQAALEEVDGLSSPQRTNNTALFSAVVEGYQVLNRHYEALENEQSSAAAQAMMVVMTDGRNEVFPGDDAGLLAGADGLDQATRVVASSPFPILGIGFGSPSEIDQDALRRLSNRPPILAQDGGQLKNAFSFARQFLTDRIQITFLSPWPDRASLAGRNLTVTATLKMPDGRRLASDEAAFETPQIGFPLFSGKASLQELAALNSTTRFTAESDWLTWLRPLFVFIGIGLFFVIAWFWLPRIIWPGQYIGNVSLPRPARKWSGRSGATVRSMDSLTGAPTGFVGVRGGAAQRKPEDATIMQPPADGTRTRLHWN
jgi:hypothetical protein